MHNRRLIWFMLLVALWLPACDISTGGLPQVKTGPTETTNVNVPLPAASNAATDVLLELGAASLELAGGANALVEGTIQTNVIEWKPTITTTVNSVSIVQGKSDRFLPDSSNTINKWNLKLGKSPINLTLKAGAYTGNINLSGVPLRGLRIEQGAATSSIRFESANPEVLKEIFVSAGASNLSLTGLGNANFETMRFEGGASNYTLDFAGRVQRNATVTVKTGVSNVTVIVPEGTSARATLTGGLRAANSEGAWQKNGDLYTMAGAGPTLTINVEMGLGALQLKNK